MNLQNVKIDATKSTVNVIGQLLKFEGAVNTTPVKYKKTAVAFKKKFGIELADAPVIFEKHNCLWKLSHFTLKYRDGKTGESADYLPIVGTSGKYKRLHRADIKTVWDNLAV